MQPVWLAMVGFIAFACCSRAQTLALPPRQTNAVSGSDFARQISSLPLADREQAILSQMLAGNIPDFLRHLRPVNVTSVADGRTNTATLLVTPDYLAVGNDGDYFLTPLTPPTAQFIADRWGCTLPTCKIVDAIYSAAELKLAPSPIPPSAAMTTVPVFQQHNDIVRTQRAEALNQYPLGALVAGHKKDVVLTAKLATVTNQVAIYGWHQTNGRPIQPLYLGHTAAWVDYSHGVRLVQQHLTANGQTTTVARVLADPKLAGLLSDEGTITNAGYQTNHVSLSLQHGTEPRARGENTALRNGITFAPAPFDERVAEFTLDPEVRIQINAPAAIAPNQPVLLVLFALPNGNTIEQTVGRKLRPGDDWHFDIQHIGAQTRFLRATLTNRTLVVAYLETKMKSWPAWRRTFGDAEIPKIVDCLAALFPTNKLELVLTGHSGGGSFTFGYLNAQEKIPDQVVRIAFLDSNYAYETTNHLAKLSGWLKSVPPPTLCVLAYHDSIALLNGKTFVSERGGTWGRSQAMLADLGAEFSFTSQTNAAGLRTHTALAGRIQFLLLENPEKKILHTVQVERNGFIHALLVGTPQENQGYQYFGERTYLKWISDH